MRDVDFISSKNKYIYVQNDKAVLLKISKSFWKNVSLFRAVQWVAS